MLRKGGNYLCAFTADSSGELHILWHDGDTLGVDGAQVGVLEQADHVSFSSFLEGQDSAALESQIALVFLSDVSDESLEWELSDQQLSGLLVSSDFTESNGAWSESVGLLDASDSWGGLSSGLASDVLAWGLSSGVLSSGLLSSCHCLF